MHWQINITSLNFQNVIQEEEITKTFQKNIKKQDLLEHGSLETIMIFIYASNLGTA